MHSCSLCGRGIVSSEPAILTVGAYGIPKYICDDCAGAIDDMTTSRELDKIAAAFDKIGSAISKNTASDGTVNRVITDIMNGAKSRAERIKDGTYDFAEDETDDDVPDEIPEELLETEEDIAELERQNKRDQKIDLITNIVLVVAIVGLAAYALIKFVF